MLGEGPEELRDSVFFETVSGREGFRGRSKGCLRGLSRPFVRAFEAVRIVFWRCPHVALARWGTGCRRSPAPGTGAGYIFVRCTYMYYMSCFVSLLHDVVFEHIYMCTTRNTCLSKCRQQLG